MRTAKMIYRLDRMLKIGLTIFVLWNAFNPLPGLQERSLFLMMVLLCLFSHDLTKSKASQSIANAVFMLCTLISFGYIAIYHNDIIYFSGMAPTFTTYLGIIAIMVLLIGCRRTAGWGLTLIIIAAMVYGKFGHLLPRNLGGHSVFSLERVIGSIYLSTDGIFGDVTYTLLKYIFLFVFFGKLLEKLGALSFITDFAQSLVGGFRGGPAIVSAISSALVGSVNGSAVANVMVTGTMSIPLMKRIGFKPEFAGGVEAAASTGGQFLPPVMGASAFLIATYLGIEYVEVAKAALIPALLFYVGIIAAIYAYSIRNHIEAIPREELPKLKYVIRDLNGLTFFVGIGTLVSFLIIGYSPIITVLIACAAMVIISFFGKNRLNIKRTMEVLNDTSEDFIRIGASGGSVGILVSMFLLSGIVLRFSGLVIGLVGDNLILVLLLTALCSIIIGFGLPTVVTYIILAIMAVPVLIDLGLNPLAAHLFVFFTGMISMVTPPVALAALAASSIAKSDFWKTGFEAFKLALPALILPFFFAMDYSLIMIGSPSEIIVNTIFAAVGVCLMSFSLTGRVRDKIEILERIAMFVSAILFIFPSTLILLPAIAILILALIRPVKKRLLSRKEVKWPVNY